MVKYNGAPGSAPEPATLLLMDLHMMFKLSQCAEKNWRKLRGFNYLAKVIKGVPFKDGVEINKSDQIAA